MGDLVGAEQQLRRCPGAWHPAPAADDSWPSRAIADLYDPAEQAVLDRPGQRRSRGSETPRRPQGRRAWSMPRQLAGSLGRRCSPVMVLLLQTNLDLAGVHQYACDQGPVAPSVKYGNTLASTSIPTAPALHGRQPGACSGVEEPGWG